MVTEAGFASDLGFEKFCHIVCRSAGLKPSAGVLVTTLRALKSHGGVAFENLNEENEEALRKGSENLAAHIDIIRAFKLRCVVAINRFPTDTDRELDLVKQLATEVGAENVVVNDGFTHGGEGAKELAEAVVAAVEGPTEFEPLNKPATGSRSRSRRSRRGSTARPASTTPLKALKDIDRMENLGFGEFPVCMAKTHLSLSHDPALIGRPKGWRLPIRSVVPSAGAGFVVVLCGDMQRMPGLGKTPAFQKVDIDEEGRTVGLFLASCSSRRVPPCASSRRARSRSCSATSKARRGCSVSSEPRNTAVRRTRMPRSCERPSRRTEGSRSEPRETPSSSSFPPRLKRSGRRSPPSEGWPGRRGRRTVTSTCGSDSTPARASSEATTTSGWRSTAPQGSLRPATAGRSCCRKPRARSWRAPCRTASRSAVSARIV
jgi:hypothetical protein